MVDLIVRDVPEGAEEKVKEMAMVAIERFLTQRDVKVAEAVVTQFEITVDQIRKDNNLTTKFEKPKEEEIVNGGI